MKIYFLLISLHDTYSNGKFRYFKHHIYIFLFFYWLQRINRDPIIFISSNLSCFFSRSSLQIKQNQLLFFFLIFNANSFLLIAAFLLFIAFLILFSLFCVEIISIDEVEHPLFRFIIGIGAKLFKWIFIWFIDASVSFSWISLFSCVTTAESSWLLMSNRRVSHWSQ